jgi:hypothetical protein
MNATRYIFQAAAALVVLAGPVHAATLATGAETLAVTPELSARIPAPHEFTVAASGTVTVTLSDLAGGNSTPFQSLKAVVSLGSAKVASLDAAGTTQFAAQPGTYRVQVVGKSSAAPASTYNVEVRAAAGNTLLLAESRAILAVAQTASPADSELDTTFTATTAGTYQVTLRDRAFPVALSFVDLAIVRLGGTAIDLTLSGPCSATACSGSFSVTTPGTYELIVVSTAGGAAQAGLYSLSITAPGGASVLSQSYPVGRLPPGTDVTLSASGSYSATLTDLVLPAAYTSLQATLTQGATLVGAPFGAGTASLTGAAAGPSKLFIAATPASSGTGAYAVRIVQGAQVAYRDAKVLPAGYNTATNVGSYRFEGTVGTAGSFRVVLRDHQFPANFGSLRAVVVQDGAVVQAQAAPGTSSSFNLAALPVQVLVIGSPQTAGSNSLFGFALESAAGTTSIVSGSQGVGGLFSTRNVTIPAAGSYDAVVNDLQFPVGFQELAVAITQGPNLVGQIFGSALIRFNAQPGTYSLNLIAKPATNAEYGTWGYDVSASPPLPAITFSANPTSITSGGTAALTWSATNATTCTATGGWTGNKATNGTETTAVLTANTSFTLSCVGPGGSSSGVVTVNVTAQQADDGGGGGRTDIELIALIAAMLAAQMVSRRRGNRKRY